MEITGYLELDSLLENFEILDTHFRIHLQDYEIQTTDGEFIFATVKAFADVKYDYEDNSIEVVSKDVDVEVDEIYFTCDRNGGELELTLSGGSVVKLEEEIKDRIEEKLT